MRTLVFKGYCFRIVKVNQSYAVLLGQVDVSERGVHIWSSAGPTAFTYRNFGLCVRLAVIVSRFDRRGAGCDRRRRGICQVGLDYDKTFLRQLGAGSD